MDIDKIKDRILEFLRAENKSSASFASEIGVQPSAISHIISGRNKPSLDFVVKMINRYPYISTDWLLFGKGSMNVSIQQDSQFASDINGSGNLKDLYSDVSGEKSLHPDTSFKPPDQQELPHREANSGNRKIRKASRIIIFYDDSSFSEHLPDGE